MLDKDLAELYHVTTGNLNKAVKRNIRRFPSDFMFQLTKEEWDSLRFQIGILEVGRGKYTKFLPHAFTEQGLTCDAIWCSKQRYCHRCKQLDAISTALAELQAKPFETKPRKPIGFIQPEDEDEDK